MAAGSPVRYAGDRHKLRALGYTVESLGGYKVKDLAEMLSVPVGRVRYWVAEKLLLTKGRRIADSSFSKFLADQPKRIPFETLGQEMQNWLREMGYPADDAEPKAAKAAKQSLCGSADAISIGGSKPRQETTEGRSAGS